MNIKSSLPEPNQLLKLDHRAWPKQSPYFLPSYAADFPDETAPLQSQPQSPSSYQLFLSRVNKVQLSQFFEDPLVYKKFTCRLDGKFNYKDQQSVLNDQRSRSVLDALQFDSVFQCANLSMVKKGLQEEYFLLLQNDSLTNSYGQWFCFKVTPQSPTTAVFKIVNNYKRLSLFSRGMKICIQEQNGKWRRGGSQIKYYLNQFRSGNRDCFTLEWKYKFSSAKTITFAYSYPYSYTDLQSEIKSLMEKHQSKHILTRKLITQTALGNRLESLIVSETADQSKQIVWVLARTHPGETVASFVMQGFIRFVLGNSDTAIGLRKKYIFKIVPMVNPDGVIVGNYRTNTLGQDLNRCWNSSNSCQISSIKRQIAYESRRTAAVIDLHGHSKQFGSFMFGCQDISCPHKCREFPYLVQKTIPQYFSMNNCRFRMKKGREGTARVNVHNKLKIEMSYTLQTSFLGAQSRSQHFTKRNLQEIGQSLCKVMFKVMANRDSRETKDQLFQLYAIKQFQKESNQNLSQSSFQDELPNKKVKKLNFKKHYQAQTNKTVQKYARKDTDKSRHQNIDQRRVSEPKKLMPKLTILEECHQPGAKVKSQPAETLNFSRISPQKRLSVERRLKRKSIFVSDITTSGVLKCKVDQKSQIAHKEQVVFNFSDNKFMYPRALLQNPRQRIFKKLKELREYKADAPKQWG